MQDAVCHRVAHFSSFSATSQPQPTLFKSQCVGPPGHIMHQWSTLDRQRPTSAVLQTKLTEFSKLSVFSIFIPVEASTSFFDCHWLSETLGPTIYAKRTRNVPKLFLYTELRIKLNVLIWWIICPWYCDILLLLTAEQRHFVFSCSQHRIWFLLFSFDHEASLIMLVLQFHSL